MTWNIIAGNPSDHLIDVQNEEDIKGKFKQPRDQGPRKLIEVSNELIVYELGRVTGLPVPPTFLTSISGRIGVVSLIESTINWSHIASGKHQSSVINLDLFRQLLPFDVWIANTDRSLGSTHHVIVKQIGDKFSFYPIDSSHTLNGYIGEVWTLENVSDTSRHHAQGYSHVSEPEISHYSQLEPMVAKIQSVSDEAINCIVDSVSIRVSQQRPSEEVEVLTKNSGIVKKLLSIRRYLLPISMINWCQTKGKGWPQQQAALAVA
jgi:hypothetical protein